MVICAAVIDEDREEELRSLGVKDSKLLTKRRREELEDRIKELLDDFAVVSVSAKSIDELREVVSLNRIESKRMAELINALRPDLAIVDATEVKTEKIERELMAQIDRDLKNRIKIKAENYADENYPIVSAASILAKVVRDRSVEELEQKLKKEIGNGYPSDSRTKRFLKEMLEKDGKFDGCVRRSWITAERIVEEKEQSGLSDFCNGQS